MTTTDLLETVSCNICGADNYKVLYQSRYENEVAEVLKDKFRSSGDETLIDQVVQCNSCGLIYINPRIKQDLIIQGYSDGTDETFVSQAKGRERTFEHCLDRIEKQTNKKAGKILDIGTANGSFLYVAKKRGWDVHGLELNKWMCDWAKKNYNIDVQPTSLFEQKYPDHTFDVVTLWDVLEHVPDPTKVLKECHRILKSDGYLVINYPDIGSWLAKIMGRKWVFLLSVHLFYFTPKTINTILKKTGFTIQTKKPHYQSLELGYLMYRMKAYSKLLHTLGYKTTYALGLDKIQIPYWLGQTFIIAKKVRFMNETNNTTKHFRKAKHSLRIHFIMPPISLEERYGKLKDMGTVYPSLGMAAIAAICEVKGHIVQVTDGEALSCTLQDINNEIKRFNPDIVGMPTFATNIDVCHDIAKKVKQINPHAKVILGGAHASIFTHHALSIPEIDFGVQSEAEIVFDEFLDALDDKKTFENIKGLAYKDSFGKVHINDKQKLCLDLNEFPMPARHLFPMDKYHSSANLRGKRTLNVMTSRGCPYRCTYCSTSQIFGQSFRYLSTENVMKEIMELRDVYHADSIQFYDETFTANRLRVIELCDAMINQDIHMQWACFTRVNLVDKELLQKMKDAGCYLIFFGIESGVQRLMDLIKKDITKEQARTAIQLCKEAGIQTWCSFIIGLPSETKEESEQTVNFALELDTEYVQFPIFMPWPGTSIYDTAQKEGVILNENLSDYTAWDKVVYKPTPDRDPEEVRITVKNAYRRFYLRPEYIARKGIDLLCNMPAEKIWKLAKVGYYNLK